jgi:hypothetical protein
MSRPLSIVLAAFTFTAVAAGPALADDTEDAVSEKSDAPAERATDCEWSRLADDELSLMCFDPSGNPSPLYVVTCGDGTTISYLGAGPGNGCDSAVGINDCRGHRGCVSVQ